jgi:hypothetical protein
MIYATFLVGTGRAGAAIAVLAVEMARENSREFVRECIETAGVTIEACRKYVVENRGRDSGDEAEGRCEKRFGDAGRDDGERGVVGCGDGRE